MQYNWILKKFSYFTKGQGHQTRLNTLSLSKAIQWYRKIVRFQLFLVRKKIKLKIKFFFKSCPFQSYSPYLIYHCTQLVEYFQNIYRLYNFLISNFGKNNEKVLGNRLPIKRLRLKYSW